ncbi:MAG: UvrD-helicase domain-containing protein [Bacteroidota bacterium]|nr:UvrD-helicase domain-containing protein [Bacteroidota bacterium]
MKVLYLHGLDYTTLYKKHTRIFKLLEEGNFAALDIKKIPEYGLYRLKLDYANRLLFQLGRHNTETCIMLLEAIYNHEYSASRFLRGKRIDENRLIKVVSSENNTDVVELPYLHPAGTKFHYLDKIISFDDQQQDFFSMQTPAIIIGSAGSGKTVLTLEKIKALRGDILYITLSSFLVQNSIKLYYAENYENEDQDVDFLSYKEFLETFRILTGKEIDFRTFEGWFLRHRNTVKIKDAHKLFEEFGGVITGLQVDREYLSREEYLALGVRQSVFLKEEREQVYFLFEKYLSFLKEHNYYDLNIISHQWLQFCHSRYDFIVIDEIQDITPVILNLILKSLKKQGQFILCGDSNQIVHPNFFSWANIKSLFYKNKNLAYDTIKILHTNYRNSPQVTDIANKLLKLKNARFGSIDKESTYLVNTVSTRRGEIHLLSDNRKNHLELDDKTRSSTRFAIIVMRNEDKAEARKIFRTPLLFSIHEAKGLEYENVVLVNFVSNYDKEFRDITEGMDKQIIDPDEINFSRAKDKTDKSLDVYKFYINSMYVAITRSVQNLYLLEASPKHRLYDILGLTNVQEQINLKVKASTKEEWNKEAARLEQQGKTEQADAIRNTILGSIQKTPWVPLTLENIDQLKKEALSAENFNKKAKDRLFDFVLLYDDDETAFLLEQSGYKRAEKFSEERNSVFRKNYTNYLSNNVKAVMNEVNKYGVDYRDVFNLTPLMASVMAGSDKIVKELLEAGANTNHRDNFGRNVVQLAIFQSYFSTQYIATRIGMIYPLVVTDNIKIKVDDRLIKINNHTIDYFVLNFLIAVQSSVILKKNFYENKGMKVDDFLEKFILFPENILYDYRKKRAYLSAHLSKNEVDRKSPDNRKLYKRVERGNYVLNTNLEIFIDDSWLNIYELMKTDRITRDNFLFTLREEVKKYEEAIITLSRKRNSYYHSEFHTKSINDSIAQCQKQLATVRTEMKKAIEKKNKSYLSPDIIGKTPAV